ncbi:MAG: proline--tRNA ligase, partial [Chloroflexota bacterium]|nr:proline--tRNA ligase [Chloroflexota bacterium]
RPRAGLIRVREFDMMDAYSFDVDDDAVLVSYEKMAQAYRNILRRCGVPALMVEADSGAIGGKYSHEFVLPSESGEDTIILCPKCSYAANAEKAQSVAPPALPMQEGPLPMEDAHTPGVKTIAELCAFLGVPPHKTLKAVFYSCDGRVVFAVLRGDLDVNEVKLKNALGAHDLRLATGPEVEAAGLVAGSASPIGLAGIRRIADPSIQMGANFVAGANRPDYHVRNVNHPRDFQVDIVTDIALAQAGQGCVRCGTPLEAKRGIEVGHIFKLGTVFSAKLGAAFLDREGQRRPAVMGCYGIGIGRLLAAAIEQNHDEKGIVFPPTIAPYQAHLVGLSLDDASVSQAADALYKELWAAGIETLYDDRLESPGVKFNDADLLGVPLRIVVSPRTMKTRSAELKPRAEKQAVNVPLAEVVGKVRERLATDGPRV